VRAASIASSDDPRPVRLGLVRTALGTTPAAALARLARGVLALLARAPLGAVAAALTAAARASVSSAISAAALAVAMLLSFVFFLRSWSRAASHLPILRLAYPCLIACLATGGCIALAPALEIRGLGAGDWLLVMGVAAITATLHQRASARGRSHRLIRVAFIGSAEAARRLRDDLARGRVTSYTMVGMIDLGRGPDPRVPVVGALGELRATVLRERIDLLVMGSAVARLPVFDELASTCLDLRLQLTELSEFYEDVFGHVPTAEINAAWFAHLVDSHARHPSPALKRAVDATGSIVLGAISLPLVMLLALVVRLDGGPAIFAQHRVGEGGRPFRLYKLRTMRVGSGDAPQWAQEHDPRTTVAGDFLRRTHLDELPQLWNILRGDMSFVGPRPEQLEFVELLERTLPFYQRRHLIRPGLTGWAQVRCGYAGSELGAAWKLCNDLYYVKHRSLGLDLLVLAETAGLVVVGSRNRAEMAVARWTATAAAPDSGPADRPSAPPVAVPLAGDISGDALASSLDNDERVPVPG
jgi:exopolysaccharide biosynthesis polyprenyl glycosylphosphotransferase